MARREENQSLLKWICIVLIKNVDCFSYLVTIVNCNFAMFAWDSWKLNSNIAMFTSTQKALWAHQRKNTAIEASTTDYHDGSVERHIDLKISLKFLTFLRAASSFLLASVFFEFLPRAHSGCSCFLMYCNWVSEPDWACSTEKGKSSRANLKMLLPVFFLIVKICPKNAIQKFWNDATVINKIDKNVINLLYL